ncbi:hypothetical protein AKJ58_00465 [candidate division MSBL1 archaeon SCGC-AAA385D11]|uniref:Ribbon-helix-helix protein CopG domain-containing protein n=1 Tax=candidate division MSBL1 archaeon SCGC-AAA385D11 TaxID=1698286 RepID=A0A133VP75_9EURY|nr:hypothetical protein AKJ58_00465 [candidate division MSBL1 archaeon SCGC-AAA385D11]
MPTVSVRVSEDLKATMEKHKEVNWSEVIRQAVKEHAIRIELADEITSKSKLTEEEARQIGERIKEGIAKEHGLVE